MEEIQERLTEITRLIEQEENEDALDLLEDLQHLIANGYY